VGFSSRVVEEVIASAAEEHTIFISTVCCGPMGTPLLECFDLSKLSFSLCVKPQHNRTLTGEFELERKESGDKSPHSKWGPHLPKLWVSLYCKPTLNNTLPGTSP
jgi:hypothetical protein